MINTRSVAHGFANPAPDIKLGQGGIREIDSIRADPEADAWAVAIRELKGNTNA